MPTPEEIKAAEDKVAADKAALDAKLSKEDVEKLINEKILPEISGVKEVIEKLKGLGGKEASIYDEDFYFTDKGKEFIRSTDPGEVLNTQEKRILTQAKDLVRKEIEEVKKDADMARTTIMAYPQLTRPDHPLTKRATEVLASEFGGDKRYVYQAAQIAEARMMKEGKSEEVNKGVEEALHRLTGHSAAYMESGGKVKEENPTEYSAEEKVLAAKIGKLDSMEAIRKASKDETNPLTGISQKTVSIADYRKAKQDKGVK